MCNQINIRPGATTKLWLTRQAQKANLPVATYAKNLLQEAAAEAQRTIDLEYIAQETADRIALQIINKLDELAE